MTTSTVTSARHAGRPRDMAMDQAILDATLGLLAERGYQDLSMAAVAERAGVGKPAVYRRHASKDRLVVAAIERLGNGPEPRLPSGTRAALGVLLAEAARAIGTPGGLTIMGSLLAQASRDPDLLEAFQIAVFQPRHAVVQDVLRRAIDRGEIAADADLEAADAMLFGAILARATLGRPLDATWIERVVSLVWRAIASDPR